MKKQPQRWMDGSNTRWWSFIFFKCSPLFGEDVETEPPTIAVPADSVRSSPGRLRCCGSGVGAATGGCAPDEVCPRRWWSQGSSEGESFRRKPRDVWQLGGFGTSGSLNNPLDRGIRSESKPPPNQQLTPRWKWDGEHVWNFRQCDMIK